jgi:NH3-dependent NAD+ synthetase
VPFVRSGISTVSLPNGTDLDILGRPDEAYVVQDRPAAEIIAAGFSEADVRRVVRLIDLSEYKRRQAAPGLKVTSRAFGVGRRQPVAQRWREI